jgi:flagellar motor switch protein FliG
LHAVGEEQSAGAMKQLTEDEIQKLNAQHLRSKASGSRVTRTRSRSFG